MNSPLMKIWLKENVDICFLTETHLVPGQTFSVPPFITVNNPFSLPTKKARGGVSCLISPTHHKYIKKIDKSSDDVIELTLTGNHKLFSSYIPPSDSLYFTEDLFASIANNFMPVDADHAVIGGGDINCRIGDKMKSRRLASGKYRDNPDTHVNSNGNSLLDICNSFRCFPLNNLTYKEKIFDGKMTFRRGIGTSQNDIVLSNRFALDMIESFTVHEISFNPSDHFPLITVCNLQLTEHDLKRKAAADLITDASEPTVKRQSKIPSSDVNWESYKTIAERECLSIGEYVAGMFRSIPSQLGVDKLVNRISKKLYSVAKTCSEAKVENIQPDEDIPFQDLLDECEESFKKYIQNEDSFEKWNAAKLLVLEENKKIHLDSVSKQWKKLISDGNPKELWNAINWKGSLAKDEFTELPTARQLSDHFLSKGSNDHEMIDISQIPTDNYVHCLDKPITLNELDGGAKLLKKGKSTCDGWCPEMISTINSALYPIILVLFNTILSSAIFPSKWRTSLVAAIYKFKGLAKHAKNYRPIALVHMLYKWFDFTLLSRFKKWFTPSDDQTAYQDERDCGDHIFLLKSLFYFAKAKGKKIFLCTIDFDGAFDRISRSILIKKLALFGAGTTFILCIAAMYQTTNSIIIQKDDYSLYTILSGIKQGLPLSPYLFLFYIDDVFEYMYAIYGRTNTAVLDQLHLLIHADDANILASTRDMLVSKIRSMIHYCNINKIVLQLTKCKFLVINGSENDNESIQIDVGQIDCVSSVMILGSPLTDTGICQSDLDLHMKERYKSIIKFYNFLRSNKPAPLSIKLKVLSACVSNALLYNCTTFGDKLPEGIDKAYHKLLRSALNVRGNTPIELIFIETGYLPIRAVVEKRQLKFFRRFKKSFRGTDPVRKFVLDNLMMEENITGYMNHYMRLDAMYADPEDIFREAYEKLKTSVQEKGATDVKYRFYIYNKINPGLTPSPFLNTMNYGEPITRFRLGSHRLPIETGRWSGIQRCQRLCPKCNVLGDEYHFLFDCTETYKDPTHYFSGELHDVWSNENFFLRFKELVKSEFL